jgi:hypothetical protein
MAGRRRSAYPGASQRRSSAVHLRTRITSTIAIAIVAMVAAHAQVASSPDPGAPTAPRVRSSNGIDYLNGGAGDESRAAILAQGAAFPLHLTFSVPSGAYAVADRAEIGNGSGTVLAVDNAGPLLLVKLPPGDYTVDATHGGKTERKRVAVGRGATTLNWRWSEQKPR